MGGTTFMLLRRTLTRPHTSTMPTRSESFTFWARQSPGLQELLQQDPPSTTSGASGGSFTLSSTNQKILLHRSSHQPTVLKKQLLPRFLTGLMRTLTRPPKNVGLRTYRTTWARMVTTKSRPTSTKNLTKTFI